MTDPAVPRGPAPSPDPGLSEPGARSPDPGPQEPPPFGRSWAGLYAIVAGTLVTLIALLALFTRAFE